MEGLERILKILTPIGILTETFRLGKIEYVESSEWLQANSAETIAKYGEATGEFITQTASYGLFAVHAVIGISSAIWLYKYFDNKDKSS